VFLKLNSNSSINGGCEYAKKERNAEAIFWQPIPFDKEDGAYVQNQFSYKCGNWLPSILMEYIYLFINFNWFKEKNQS